MLRVEKIELHLVYFYCLGNTEVHDLFSTVRGRNLVRADVTLITLHKLIFEFFSKFDHY